MLSSGNIFFFSSAKYFSNVKSKKVNHFSCASNETLTKKHDKKYETKNTKSKHIAKWNIAKMLQQKRTDE